MGLALTKNGNILLSMLDEVAMNAIA
jgi:hypothetical protein